MDDGGPPTRRQDLAASQIVGFILMFAMTFVVLTVAMVVVSDRVRSSRHDVRRTLLAEAGAAVADAIREAAAFADLHPDATLHRHVDLPDGLAGAPYSITATNDSVVADPGGADGDPLRFGGYDLTASGIHLEPTRVHGATLHLVYERCHPGETNGICEPEARRDRRNLVIGGIW